MPLLISQSVNGTGDLDNEDLDFSWNFLAVLDARKLFPIVRLHTGHWTLGHSPALSKSALYCGKQSAQKICEQTVRAPDDESFGFPTEDTSHEQYVQRASSLCCSKVIASSGSEGSAPFKPWEISRCVPWLHSKRRPRIACRIPE